MSGLVILGGGSAGWLTAAYLAARLRGAMQGGLQLTLVEASDIPTIGVGEATTPSLRATTAEIGFTEPEFLRAALATFKHGIRFVDWSAPGEAYFHPFERPLRAGPEGIAEYWLRGLAASARPFSEAVCIQSGLAAEGLAPKRAEDPGFTGPMPYAYHLDAGQFAEALKAKAMQRGVRRIVAKVCGVESWPDGRIRALLLEGGERCEGHLFIDCSGFHSRLIGEHCKSPFEDRTDVLFCDRAVVCQVPHGAAAEIAPYTTATAQACGWIWDIGLSARRGVGHVYSSRHTTPEDAEAVLRAYIGPPAETVAARHLSFRVGYRPEPWVGNCVAVGLAAGFVEPLESTGILMIEQAAWALAALAPRHLAGGAPQAQFNALMRRHFSQIIDFVKFHYVLSQRRDSAFWRENVDPQSWTPWLVEKLETWRSAPPDIWDFESLHSIFDQASYQYVGFGMGWRPHATHPCAGRDAAAAQVFERVAGALGKARKVLPRHRALLEALQQQPAGPVVGAAPRFSTSTLAIPYNYAS